MAAFEIAGSSHQDTRTDLPAELKQYIRGLIEAEWVFSRKKSRAGGERKPENLKTHVWATDRCARIGALRLLLRTPLADVVETARQEWWQHTQHLVQFQEAVDSLLDGMNEDPPLKSDGTYDFLRVASLHYSAAALNGCPDALAQPDMVKEYVKNQYPDYQPSQFMRQLVGVNPILEMLVAEHVLGRGPSQERGPTDT